MDEETNQRACWIAAAFLAAILLIIVYFGGWCDGRNTTRREAVRAGVACYATDEQGDAQFKWKTKAEGEDR